MRTVTVHEAKTQLSRFLAEVEETGVEIVIARRDKPVARLVPMEKETCNRERLFGSLSTYLNEDAVEYLTSAESDELVAKDFEESVEKE